MFDFLPKDYIISNPNDVSSDIYLTSSRLTEKVVNNSCCDHAWPLNGERGAGGAGAGDG